MVSSPADAPSIPWYRWPAHQLRRLYHWTMSWAETPYAYPALFVLAFVEASFFPIPPDVLLLAMALAKPSRAFVSAAVCTAGSVAGAALGWGIGVAFWAGLGTYAECPDFGGGALLFEYIPGFNCHKFEVVQGLYAESATFWIFASAFTPIPFKVFTIAAGVFQISLPLLLGVSLFGRGARFFLIATLIWRFGPPVREFIEKRFEMLTFVFAVLLVGGFVIMRYAF